MNPSLKPLKHQVIVITGASSGIGLATARSAAAQGARVVLASRNADVGRREDVQRIADAALQHFGGFDTWVNNAGLGIVGRIEDGTEEDFRRLFDTNFWGVVNGSLVALPHLKQHGGALINLGSVASDVSLPYQGMYSTTKHAIKGFTDALRIELSAEKAPVSVTLIKPASINTPFPHHAKNYTDKEPRLPPPVYAPQEVAVGILHAAVHGGRDIYIGGAGRLMSAQNKFAPALIDQISKALIPKTFRDEPPGQPAGALRQAGMDGEVDSDHPGPVLNTSLYTRASFHPAGAVLLMAVIGAVAAAVLRGDRSEK